MQIVLNNIGKQFNGEWIFKSISLIFLSGGRYWISGNNGSGKSSLLKLITSFSVPSVGKIEWSKRSNEITQEIKKEEVYSHVSVCAPYISLFEKHTVIQAVEFHLKFKTALFNLSVNEIIDLCYLSESKHKQIDQLSSGMQQRLKLALAIISDTSVLILDEPCSNLDEQAIAWYQNTLTKFAFNRLIIIASNHKKEEHFICESATIFS